MLNAMILKYASDFQHHIPPGIWLLCLFCVLNTNILFAQNPPRKEVDLNELIQNTVLISGEDAELEDIYEALLQAYSTPYDINKVTADELSSLYILSDTQIQSLLTYRQNLGPFISLYELQAVPGFNLETIQNILPFLVLPDKSFSFKDALQTPTQHFLMLRSGKLLETQKGFKAENNSPAKYVGKPWNGYLRYRYARTGAYSVGLTIEKDAGEQFWNWQGSKQIYGFDYTSFHAQIMNRGRLKNLIIGDYQLQIGQGLILSSGFALGKGAEVIRSVYRSTLGARPYTSGQETNFFRGAAAKIELSKALDLTVFYSRTRRDANLISAQNDSSGSIASSIIISGYHRTASERDNQGAFVEQNMGANISYRFPSQKGSVGMTLLNSEYEVPLIKRDLLYNKYEFSGTHNLNIGINGEYRWQNIHFFGEFARSQSGGTGALAGLVAGLSKKLDFSMLIRNYEKNFHTFYGNSFAESTRPINERGVFSGFRYTPSRRWQFSLFYDYFRFPWLKYLVNTPSDGHDFLFHALWNRNKRMTMYFLFHQKHKQRNEPGAKAPAPVIKTVHRTIMLNFEYNSPLKFNLHTRIQYGDMNYKTVSKSKGFAIVQDFSRRFGRLEASARAAFFKTDDYDSRQYVYEKDMLYSFSIPAYYDTGTRHYLMLKYNLTKKMKVWLRWSQTRYTNLDKISSGTGEIQGNKRSEVKMQMMYQF